MYNIKLEDVSGDTLDNILAIKITLKDIPSSDQIVRMCSEHTNILCCQKWSFKMKVYNPKADEFDIDNKINILKNLPSDNLNISILNSRWDSMMNHIMLKKELKLFKNVQNINSHKISHSEPTDITLLNHVTDWSHFAILGCELRCIQHGVAMMGHISEKMGHKLFYL